MHLTRRLSNLWVSLQGLSSCPRDLSNTQWAELLCFPTCCPSPSRALLSLCSGMLLGRYQSHVDGHSPLWLLGCLSTPRGGCAELWMGKTGTAAVFTSPENGEKWFSGWYLEELHQEKASLASSASLEPGRDLSWMRHPVQQRGLEVGFL